MARDHAIVIGEGAVDQFGSQHQCAPREADLARRKRNFDFAILAFDAPEDVLRARVRARLAAGGDASEADEAVLEAQLRSREGFDAEELARVLPIDTRSVPDWRSLLPALSRLWPGAPRMDSRPSTH